LVSDVMVAIELACREAGIRLLSEEELTIASDTSPRRQPFQWKVNITSSLQLGIIPDRVFALEFGDQSGIRTRAFFFLEADRGTMPVTRRNLSQTSFYRKLLAYEATWSQSIHRTRFGFYRFRVLTVTASAERVNSLLNACSKLKSGHGLFLFADRTVLEKSDDIFSPIWLSGGRDQTASLLD
jgi:Replication-relaxation